MHVCVCVCVCDIYTYAQGDTHKDIKTRRVGGRREGVLRDEYREKNRGREQKNILMQFLMYDE